MKTIYYYQSFCGLEKIMVHPQDLDNIILSALHFGEDKGVKYIHLNNYDPDDIKFKSVWEELSKLYYDGVTITLMIGGAGGAYENLFKDFDNYYKLLKDTIKKHNIITGVDLDIEEEVDINNVKRLINKLVSDFGEDFIITMAPVSSSLMTDGSSMGGFSYKDLYDSDEGNHIDWFNVQCYGSFNSDTYSQIIDNGYPASKIVFGMLSGDDNFNDVLNEIKKVIKKYPKMLGVDVWEYINAPPNPNDPSEWAKKIRDLTEEINFSKRESLGIWAP